MISGTLLSAAVGWGLLPNVHRLASAVAIYADPERAALKAELAGQPASEIKVAYAMRGYRPIWLKGGRAGPDGRELLQDVTASVADDLVPEHYAAGRLASRLSAPGASSAERAQTDLLLTRAYTKYVLDLHSTLPAARVVYTDASMPAPASLTASEVLDALATAPSVHAAMQAATRMNLLYVAFRRAAADSLGGRTKYDQRLLFANLERLRALPAYLGRRFILVDAAHARLWMYQDGRAVGDMKVVVGKPDEATPMLAGVIRYAVFNPSWNVPPDLVQKVYAPRILKDPSTLVSLKMDPWTDYTAEGQRLEPLAVDWLGVQAGVMSVGLRQRPGPWNYMGAVKFMLPNELGIYLHDTPNKALFMKADRAFSAGCVRVEDYKRLAAWLYGGSEVGPKNDRPDQRVDLPDPAPVYITYLTAWFDAGGITTASDIYARDQPLLREMDVDRR